MRKPTHSEVNILAIAGAVGLFVGIQWAGDDIRPRGASVDGPVRSELLARGNVYYRNCDAARSAGVAPLRRGDAGYRPPLDRDDDGIACEPYR